MVVGNAMRTYVPYGITEYYLPPAFPRPLKLVLDSATPKGCKAELT